MVLLGTAGGLFGAALQEAYYMPFAMMGRYSANEAQMSKVPTTPTLLAPGAKLSDFTNIVFSAYAGNGAMSSRGWGQSYFTHPYLDADGNLQFVVTTVSMAKRIRRCRSTMHQRHYLARVSFSARVRPLT